MSSAGQTAATGASAANSAAVAKPGLINTAPGAVDTNPGSTPTGANGPGAPVTGYNPATAAAAAASPNVTSTDVPANATVASQLHDIIASGSPLMQQAETNAKQTMNQRGLINSSQAITAGDSAVISAAEPIAAADAASFAQAARDTASAKNAANLQDSSLQTNTSQFNAGQSNAALSAAASASNTLEQTAQQIAGQTNIADIQTTAQQAIAKLQAETSLTVEDKQAAVQQIIAGIQANTSLTNQDKQDATNTIIAQMNNAESLQAIQAQGTINTQIAQLNDQYGQLTQTDQAAQQFYTQGLANLASIVNNTNLSADQKAQALNDGVAELNSGLQAISQIANTPEVQSSLNFGGGAVDPNTGQLLAVPNPASIINSPLSGRASQ